jgi:hypothetical protein
MGAPGDLTTLAAVKAWRSPPITTTADDPQIARLVGAASAFILRYLQRNLVSQTYHEIRNGSGGRSLLLREAPVTAIASLIVDGAPVPAAADTVAAGYALDATGGVLHLRGYAFGRGVQNIAIDYVAGYRVDGEAHTVPASAPYEVSGDDLARLWSSDAGVAFAGGAALTALPQGAMPAAGQYVPPAAPDGAYVFAAADAGSAVAVSYSYTPADIEQACIELALMRLNERGRIGEASKSQAGEIVSYTQIDMPASVTAALLPYRRVVPIL